MEEVKLIEVKEVEKQEVEKILNKRKVRGVVKYFIQFMAEHNSCYNSKDLEWS